MSNDFGARNVAELEKDSTIIARNIASCIRAFVHRWYYVMVIESKDHIDAKMRIQAHLPRLRVTVRKASMSSEAVRVVAIPRDLIFEWRGKFRCLHKNFSWTKWSSRSSELYFVYQIFCEPMGATNS